MLFCYFFSRWMLKVSSKYLRGNISYWLWHQQSEHQSKVKIEHDEGNQSDLSLWGQLTSELRSDQCVHWYNSQYFPLEDKQPVFVQRQEQLLHTCRQHASSPLSTSRCLLFQQTVRLTATALKAWFGFQHRFNYHPEQLTYEIELCPSVNIRMSFPLTEIKMDKQGVN